MSEFVAISLGIIGIFLLAATLMFGRTKATPPEPTPSSPRPPLKAVAPRLSGLHARIISAGSGFTAVGRAEITSLYGQAAVVVLQVKSCDTTTIAGEVIGCAGLAEIVVSKLDYSRLPLLHPGDQLVALVVIERYDSEQDRFELATDDRIFVTQGETADPPENCPSWWIPIGKDLVS